MLLQSTLKYPTADENVSVCVRLVQHGMVYQECDANGQWVTMKNTSECDENDPSLVKKTSLIHLYIVQLKQKPLK